MSSPPKYRSKPVFWDVQERCVPSKEEIAYRRFSDRSTQDKKIYRFDSTLEFNVFLRLVDLFGLNRVVCQYPLQIIPPGYCYKSGKKWKVDFAILDDTDRNFPAHFVEAKGAVMPEFRHCVASFEYR